MKEAKELLEKYNTGKCTSKELLLLQKWFHLLNSDEVSELTETDLNNAQHALQHQMTSLIRKSSSVIHWPRIVVAAAILIIVSIGTFFYLNYIDKSISKQAISNIKNDISPGGNIATLTLADGRKISLTDAENGQLAEQSGIKIHKTADGQLVYEVRHLEGGTTERSLPAVEMTIKK